MSSWASHALFSLIAPGLLHCWHHLDWRRADLFNVSLQITGNVTLHNQTSPHITLSKLAFPSHCICFYCVVICPVSSADTIAVISFAWFQWNGCLIWTGRCFSYFIYCVGCEPIMICSTSAAHVPLVYLVCVILGHRLLWAGHCFGYSFHALFAYQ